MDRKLLLGSMRYWALEMRYLCVVVSIFRDDTRIERVIREGFRTWSRNSTIKAVRTLGYANSSTFNSLSAAFELVYARSIFTQGLIILGFAGLLQQMAATPYLDKRMPTLFWLLSAIALSGLPRKQQRLHHPLHLAAKS